MSIRDHICGAHNVSLILIHFTGNAFYLLTCRICASLEVQCQSISRSSCKVGGKAWTLCVCVAQLTCHVILFLASPLLDALYVGGGREWCGVTIRLVFVHNTCGMLCARYPSRKMPI